jgi:hypothetical protein
METEVPKNMCTLQPHYMPSYPSRPVFIAIAIITSDIALSGSVSADHNVLQFLNILISLNE